MRLIAGVNKELSDKVSAVDLVNHMVGKFGGKEEEDLISLKLVVNLILIFKI